MKVMAREFLSKLSQKAIETAPLEAVSWLQSIHDMGFVHCLHVDLIKQPELASAGAAITRKLCMNAAGHQENPS